MSLRRCALIYVECKPFLFPPPKDAMYINVAWFQNLMPLQHRITESCYISRVEACTGRLWLRGMLLSCGIYIVRVLLLNMYNSVFIIHLGSCLFLRFIAYNVPGAPSMCGREPQDQNHNLKINICRFVSRWDVCVWWECSNWTIHHSGCNMVTLHFLPGFQTKHDRA